MGEPVTQFDRWPTGTKLLLILTAALLPLGLALAWSARDSLQSASRANRNAAIEQGRVLANEIESLIARNALGLGIAANGAFQSGTSDPCAATAQSLALTPAIGARFVIREPGGEVLCTHGGARPNPYAALPAPGDILLWVSPLDGTVHYRVGVIGGMATGSLPVESLAATVRRISPGLRRLSVSDGHNTLAVVSRPTPPEGGRLVVTEDRIGRSQLLVRAAVAVERADRLDRLAMLLPFLMWVVAALVSWLLVRRMLIQPLGRLQQAVADYQPGTGPFELPEKLGPATEIHALGESFARAVKQIESSERQMGEALEGQRRLVREVHHRVKNNLQVVASLLNIHGRNAATPDATAAYAAIGRRVDALSVVHRNHFADVEESRGIALRPLLVELAQTLRASVPDQEKNLRLQLDVEPLYTTQDAAVAAAFFVTEVVEFAMLQQPAGPLDIELRRINELTAGLTIASDALRTDKDREIEPERVQFGRIIGGLARQLRSPLDERMGRVGVDIPVFPER